MTGRTMSAEDALRLGIVDFIAPDDGIEVCVRQLIEDVLRTTPIAQSILKQALAQPTSDGLSSLVDSLAGAYLAESGETISTTIRRSQ